LFELISSGYFSARLSTLVVVFVLPHPFVMSSIVEHWPFVGADENFRGSLMHA
jgi:hypothetical protein